MQLWVIDGWMSAQRAAELTVEVVFLDMVTLDRTFHQELHSTVGEQPNTDIRQIEMVFEQFCEAFGTGLLQHLLQHVRGATVADKDPVILGDRGIKPKSIAHHVSIGDRSYALSSTDIDIAADNHRSQTFGSLSHHTLIERQLQVKQGLRQSLATLPTENGDGGENLATGGIRGQSATLSACM